jgi:anti-sigma28 factor (negative regulator of flagellin synthesis)
MTAANLTSSPSPLLPPPPRDPSAIALIPLLQAMPASDSTPKDTARPPHDLTPAVLAPLRRQDVEFTPRTTATGLVPLFEQQSPVQKIELVASTSPNMGRTMVTSSVNGQRPSTPRAQTDPSSPFDTLPTHHTRPRNRSPYSRSHLRSHSGSSSPSAPPMMRAHSLPSVVSPSGYLSLSPSPMPGRPSSPLRSPKRTRSPRSQPALYEESYAHAGTPSVCDISEDAELELTPKPGPLQPSPLSGLYSGSGSLSRRRRPASPLHQVAFGAVSAPAVRTPTSDPSSPMLSAAKFNEPFPGMNAYYSSSHASSSVPSTPTSMRSRSPSISSLETIEDTPDEEVEAIEADRIARLKAAIDREKEGTEGGRRSSLDVPGGSGRALGFGKRDSRKRWSVCGAERRGDLDLETIWED